MMDGTVTPRAAFAAYLAVRDRLPRLACHGACLAADRLADVVAPYEVVLLDAYGVLNVGEEPVPGAADLVASLRRAGKRVMVVTNSAGYPKRVMLERYARLGLDLSAAEVTSSREAMLAALPEDGRLWGLMLSPAHGTEDLGALCTTFLADDPAAYDAADGFLLVGSEGWTEARQALLESALARRPRPVVVGNPDLVAPRHCGLTLEPGYFAHRLADRTGLVPECLGKPFPGIYDLALSRLPPVSPERVLMVGDTLHTDVLGAKAMGFAAALVTGYGSLAEGDAAAAIDESGIRPDHIVARL